MNKSVLMGLAVVVAGVASAEVTVEGIGVSDAGFTMTKKGLGDKGLGLGKFPEGFSISSIDDALQAVEKGYVIWDNTSGFPDETKRVVAGYIGTQSGFFNYQEDDGGYAVGRWSQNECSLFGASGTIVVPSAGSWTLALGGRDGSWTSLSVKGDGVDSYQTRLNGNADELMLVPIDFPAAGSYDVEIFQYFPPNGAWLELSAAKGAKDTFNTTDFHLIGEPLTTYTITFTGAEGETLSTQDVKKGRHVLKPADPVRAGYAFTGWLLNGMDYDFTESVDADLTLVAGWGKNIAPIVTDLTYAPLKPVIEGTGVDVTLSVTAFDGDYEDLTYHWSLVGEAPSSYSFDDMTSATPVVTLNGPGTFTFAVTVSDGHETATGTVTVTVSRPKNATTFAYVGPEYAGSPIGTQGTTQNPDITAYPWGAANHDGYKAAWRSTASGAKNWLLEKPLDRPNAYGLDGYIFPGRCLQSDAETGDVTVDNVTSGVSEDGGMTVNKVTDYIASFSWTNGNLGNEPGIYWIDDPTRPVSEDVKDFRPSAFTVQNVSMDAYTTFATIRLSNHAARYPKIRIGILSGYGDGFKPKAVSVGGAAHDWEGSGEGYGHLTWMFFDVDNPKNASQIDLAIKGQNTWSACRIEGIVFDSTFKTPGFTVKIR